MIKVDTIREDIHKLLPEIRSYLESNPKILFAYLFGSLAQRKQTPLSDVDIAVYLSDTSSLPEDKLEIVGHFINILETDEIDLVILNTAPLPLAARIIENKIILADKQPFLRHNFESLTLRKYFDFSIKEWEILKRRYLIGR
ncbi:MAG: nucleotidyltransferase domain-containing protein [Planctomycetes bacterium]|nr:nucleotidyltransferase domain-containing protein [Planctomycetota bacterium]